MPINTLVAAFSGQASHLRALPIQTLIAAFAGQKSRVDRRTLTFYAVTVDTSRWFVHF